MKTAEEILKECFKKRDIDVGERWWIEDEAVNAMKAYAKEVATEALKRAAENAGMILHDGRTKEDKPLKYYQIGADNLKVNRLSILNTDITDLIK